MDVNASVDLAVAAAALAASFSPVITGFLQQWKKETLAKAPWFAKGAINSAIGSLIATIVSYAANGDTAMSAAAGAVVAVIGSVNIAFRKGTRGNLEVVLSKKD